jgi:hypothetical protein
MLDVCLNVAFPEEGNFSGRAVTDAGKEARVSSRVLMSGAPGVAPSGGKFACNRSSSRDAIPCPACKTLVDSSE